MAAKQIQCKACDKKKNIREFYVSDSDKYTIHEGYCPYCKDCLKKIIMPKGRFTKTGFKSALKDYLDKPFLPDLLDASKEMATNEDGILGIYLSKLNIEKKNRNVDKLTWEDSEKEKQGKKQKKENKQKNICVTNSKDVEIENIENIFSKEELFKLENKWGAGFSQLDYLYLEDQYKDLCINYSSDDSYTMQMIFEEICLTRLTLKKKREIGDDVTKETKSLLDLLGSASIKPSQESANNIEKGAWGVFINKIEDEEPIPHWEKDLGHIDYLGKFVRVYFIGNLLRALDLPNPWQQEYDEEMLKYTAIKDDIEEEDDEDGYLK